MFYSSLLLRLLFLLGVGESAAEGAFPTPLEKIMNVFDKAYGYNKEMAKGSWFTTKAGVRVKLAYQNSEEVLAYVRALNKERATEKGGVALTTDDHEAIGRRAFKEKVLLDWEADLEFTEENIEMVMNTYPDFVTECISIAQNNKRFQEKEIEDNVGN